MQLSRRQKYWAPKIFFVTGYSLFVVVGASEYHLLGAIVLGLCLTLVDVVFKKLKVADLLLTLLVLCLIGLAWLEAIPVSFVALTVAAAMIHAGGAVFLAAIQSIILQREGAKPMRISDGLGGGIALILGWTIIFYLVYA